MTEDEQGNIVAKAVWSWLRREKAISYVPWVLNPNSSEFNGIKAARQTERNELLDSLEDCIRTASKSAIIGE